MRKRIPVEERFEEWRRDPTYVAASEALAGEFAVAGALIAARSKAGLSQEQVAERMQTAQSTVARLEGGRSNVTLQTLRRFADATGTRLTISFDPVSRQEVKTEAPARRLRRRGQVR